ncbi:MAG: hypothetical protein FWH03_01175 [Firmicutes bacterium]|nr:hypothetical protein [Bacillota bacterium]
MKNPHEKNIPTNCAICAKPFLIDKYGSGRCENCGWKQTGLDKPDDINWNYNFISFNKAKQLFSEGKPIKPDFSDFLACMRVYNELEFYYKGKHYGVLTDNYEMVDFYEWNVMEGVQIYTSIEEFAAKANINDVLLKDIWSSVEKVGTAS